MWLTNFNYLKLNQLLYNSCVTTICMPQLASWLSFCFQAFLYKVYISIRKHWICKKKSEIICHISPHSGRFHHRRGIGLLNSDWLWLRPIEDDAGPGEVKSWNCEIPPGSPLHYSGRGGGGRGFSYLLESHMTYLAGTHPQELASNTVNPIAIIS